MKKTLCMLIMLLNTMSAHSMEQYRLSQGAPEDTIATLRKNPNARDAWGDPLFFKLTTIAAVREFMGMGTDIYARDKYGANVLVHALHDEYPLELMEFYVNNGVKADELYLLDHSCLLQRLAWSYLFTFTNSVNFLDKAKYLLEVASSIINTLDRENKTALNIAYRCLARFSHDLEKKETMQVFIALLRLHGAKTGKEVQALNKQFCIDAKY